MTQQSGNQFEDDLTIGFENNDSFSTDPIDLFEFTGGAESPIARLKTIILSIDWEINDDILQQLDDELVDLGDIWENDKIKLVYIQGLSKIGKYIYKEKANAHPNAIKLLITFYHNLEKIVSADDVMSEDEKKEILLEDIKKFDQLKSQIGKPSTDSDTVVVATPAFASETQSEPAVEELKTLKARVLGIDWEIKDQELQKLGDEVNRLEKVYRNSKAKLILLQGIGALCSYINKMRSKSNSKAFTLMHSFYEVLERIPSGDLPPGEDKQLLLAEVEKFKSFKVGITQDKVSTDSVETNVEATPDVIADVSREVLPAQDDDSGEVSADIESRLLSVFGEVEEKEDNITTDKSFALEGVNVETEADDDSDEEDLPFTDGMVAPALSEVDQVSSFSVDKLAGDLAKSIVPETQDLEKSVGEKVVPGVDVETEEDDDSGEEALPFIDGNVAPALVDSDGESGFNEATFAAEIEKSESEDLDNRLDSFFDDVQDSSLEGSETLEQESAAKVEAAQPIAALSDVEEGSDFLDDGDLTSALGQDEDILTAIDSVEENLEEKLSFFDDDVPAPELDDSVEEKDEDEISYEETEARLSFLDDDIPPSDSIDTEEIFEDESKLDEEISAFFDDSALTPALSEDADISFEEEHVEEEIEGDTSVDQLSFLDEDIPAPDHGLSDTAEQNVEDVVQKETDDDHVAVEEEIEEGLSFFDKDSEELEGEGEPADTIEIGEVDEIEEILDVEEIEFTVPGEITAVGATALLDEKKSSDDVIDFQVPGEEISSEIAFTSTEEIDKEEVLFEVVGDDVEVDLLPGEEFVDSEDERDEDETVEFLVADQILPESVTGSTAEPVFVDYAPLQGTIKQIQEDVTDTNIQVLFAEINKTRSQSASNIIGKIFLQLLSTVSQHIERNLNNPDSASLSLMDDIFSGIQMSSSSDVSSEQVQWQLLSCTSQVLLVQQKDVANSGGSVSTEEAV